MIVAVQPTNSERASLAARERQGVVRDAQKSTDVRVTGADLFLLPVQTRVPLKFGPETLTSVTCARVRLQVTDRNGRSAYGWGETPLSVQWAWPGTLKYADRHDAMIDFAKQLIPVWVNGKSCGHPCEITHDFLQATLPALRQQFNHRRRNVDQLPFLAALICASAFDIALHDVAGSRRLRWWSIFIAVLTTPMLMSVRSMFST